MALNKRMKTTTLEIFRYLFEGKDPNHQRLKYIRTIQGQYLQR